MGLLVKALISGKYSQGRGTLYNPTTKCHCVMGVACEVVMKAVPTLKIHRVLVAPYVAHYELPVHGLAAGIRVLSYGWVAPPEVIEWLGISYNSGMTLSGQNDKGASFTKLAKLLSAPPKGLFIHD